MNQTLLFAKVNSRNILAFLLLLTVNILSAQGYVTFRVNLINQAVDNGARISYNAGSGWNDNNPMTLQSGHVYTFTLPTPVAPGTTIQYIFLNGGAGEAGAQDACDGGSPTTDDGINRQYTYTGPGNVTLDPVCFGGYCTDCVPLIIQVNLASQAADNGAKISYNTGSGWNDNKDMTPLGNHLYSYTLWNVTPGSNVQYIFQNGAAGEAGAQNACDGGSPTTDDGINRQYTYPGGAVTLDPVCFGGYCTDCIPFTFQVNLANQEVDNGAKISYNVGTGWNDNKDMTPLGNRKYAYTIYNVPPGTTIEYIFINGGAGEAAAQDACDGGSPVTDDGFNRKYTYTGPGALTLDPVCFGGYCTDCIPFTFQVNLTNQAVDNGAKISYNAGTGWNDNKDMTPLGNRKYAYTIYNVPPGTTIEYIFQNGGAGEAGAQDACDGGSPTTDDGFNRKYTYTGPGAVTLDPVCFGGYCTDCIPFTFQVNLANQVVDNGAKISYNVGTGWNDNKDMTPLGNHRYSYTIWNVTPGATVQYIFSNGAAGEAGAQNACDGGSSATDDGHNRVYEYAGGAMVLDPVCFGGYCTDCIPFIFQVNLNNQAVDNGAKISFNIGAGWNDNNDMTPLGNHIYSYTLWNIPPGTTVQYIFSNGAAGESGAQNACDGGDIATDNGINRVYEYAGGPVTLPAVCFGGYCTDCEPFVFQVNLASQAVDNGARLNYNVGAGWSDNNIMTHVGNHIYTYTLYNIPPGTTVQYIFRNGAVTETGAANACDGGLETTNDGDNRIYQYTGGAVFLPAVCFGGHCTDCTPFVFTLSLANETVDNGGVISFNTGAGWNDNNPMTPLGDHLYSYTLYNIPPGTNVEYTYKNGAVSEGDAPNACDGGSPATNDGFNRVYTATAGPDYLSPVCFGSCSNCISYTSVTTSTWNAASTWINNAVPPGTNESVIIATATTVTIHSPVTIRDLSVQAGGKLVVNADVTLINATLAGPMQVNAGKVLTVQGSLVSNGYLSLASGAVLMHGTGTPGAGGSLSGEMKLARSGSGNYAYNYVSSPVAGASINGIGRSRYYYDPAAGTTDPSDDRFDPGWKTASGLMEPGRGYAVFDYRNINFHGIANNGTLTREVQLPCGTCARVNLIGNPYPSPISANAFLATNGPLGSNRVGGALYFWDDDFSLGNDYNSADYAVWNGAGGISASGKTPNGRIAVGQGFMVLANNTGPIWFSNSMRSSSAATFFEEDPMSRIRLSLTSDNDYNETLIAFTGNATEGQDALYDAPKMIGNAALALFSLQGTYRLAIQGLPELTYGRSVGIGYKSTHPGLHTLRLKSLEHIDPSVLIYLEDLEFGTFTNLRLRDEYTFTPGSVKAERRFRLHFTAPVTISSSASVDCDAANGSIAVNNPAKRTLHYSLTPITSQEPVAQGASDEAAFTIGHLVPGVYRLNMTTEDGYAFSSLTEVPGNETVYLHAGISNAVPLAGQGIEFFASSNVPVTWLLADGTVIGEGETLSQVFDQPGQYTLIAKASDGSCEQYNVLSFEVYAPTGLEEITGRTFILLPNPAGDKTELLFSSGQQNELVHISLTDVTGRDVFKQTSLASANGKVTIPLETVARGIYLLSVNGTSIHSSVRLVVN